MSEWRSFRSELTAPRSDILVLLSDMTRNTVWQMLARSTRAFLEAPHDRRTRS